MKPFRPFVTVVAVTVLSAGVAAQGRSGQKPTTQGHGQSNAQSSKPAPPNAHGGNPNAGGGQAKAGGSTTTTTTAAAAKPAPGGFAAKLSANPNQKARFEAMLPAGMTLEQATTGFRNQGQFVAALNASKNQGVPFVDLQKAMTVDGLSLGQAVKQLKAVVPPPTTTGTTGSTSGSTTSSAS